MAVNMRFGKKANFLFHLATFSHYTMRMTTVNSSAETAIATSLADPAKLAQNLAQVYERMARLAQMMAQNSDAQRQESETQTVPIAQISRTLGEVWQAHLAQPEKLVEMQGKLWQQYAHDLAKCLDACHGARR